MANTTNTQKEKDLIKCQTWEDLFNLTIDITKKEIHCATLAKFTGRYKEEWNKDKGYGIAIFEPWPKTTNQENYEISAYFFNHPIPEDDEDDEEEEEEYLKKDKLYCIIFTDYNYRTSVEAMTQLNTLDTEVHSLSFGLVVDIK